jgi:hypothetical protein
MPGGAVPRYHARQVLLSRRALVSGAEMDWSRAIARRRRRRSRKP